MNASADVPQEDSLRQLQYMLKIKPIVRKHKRMLIAQLLHIASEISPTDYYTLKAYGKVIADLAEPFQPCMNNLKYSTEVEVAHIFSSVRARFLIREIMRRPDKNSILIRRANEAQT